MGLKVTRLNIEPNEPLFFAYHPEQDHLVVGPAARVGERERFHDVFREVLRERYGLSREDAELLYENDRMRTAVHTRAVSGVIRGKSIAFTRRNLSAQNLWAALLALHHGRVVTPEHSVGVGLEDFRVSSPKARAAARTQPARVAKLGRVKDLYSHPSYASEALYLRQVTPIRPPPEPSREEVQTLLEIARIRHQGG